MPAPFTSAPLRFRHPPHDDRGALLSLPELGFELSPCRPTPCAKSLQARLRGRSVLTPVLDLKTFETAATVDWIELGLETTRLTQSLHLSDVLAKAIRRRPWVAGMDGKSAFSADRFKLRLQDATPKLVQTAIGELRREGLLAGEPWVEAIEVAIDFTPHDGLDASRWLMVEVLRKHFLPHKACFGERREHGRCFVPRRPGGDDGETRYLVGGENHDLPPAERKRMKGVALSRLMLDPVAHQAAFVDGTVYFGSKEADVVMRLQNKITNQRKSIVTAADGELNEKVKVEKLDQAAKRARIEVALKRPALVGIGLIRMGDLRHFKFEQLRTRWFEFWRPTFDSDRDVDADRLAVFFKSGVYGLEAMDRERAKKIHTACRKRPGAGATGTRLRFDELGSKSHGALRRLSGRWGKLVV